jgi:hypothetical protein
MSSSSWNCHRWLARDGNAASETIVRLGLIAFDGIFEVLEDTFGELAEGFGRGIAFRLLTVNHDDGVVRCRI